MDITVFDTQGRFVADATTSVGATTATTDAKGHAILTIPTGAEQVVAVSKADFADQYKVVNLAADASVVVPEIHGELSTDKLLVLGFIKGTSLTRLEMLREGWAAPTLHLTRPDPQCAELDYVMHEPRSLRAEFAASHNFAFGGVNTSLVFRCAEI